MIFFVPILIIIAIVIGIDKIYYEPYHKSVHVKKDDKNTTKNKISPQEYFKKYIEK